MCCICWFLFGDKKPKICQACGEKTVRIYDFVEMMKQKNEWYICPTFSFLPFFRLEMSCEKMSYDIQAVEMRFTKLGLLLCIGGSLYCCIGLCCLFLLRERHCPFCYKKSFEEIARVRRRIQCLVDDKSEITVEETEHSDNSS